jgi:hypothetical protein
MLPRGPKKRRLRMRLLLTQTCVDADVDFKGAFNLCMRLYAPKSDALTGKWNPPPVVKVEGPSEAMPQ